MLGAQVSHGTTRAVSALGAKNKGDIPKPLTIPSPNPVRPRREAVTRHDLLRPFLQPGVKVVHG